MKKGKMNKGRMRRAKGTTKHRYYLQSFKIGYRRQKQFRDILRNSGYDVEYSSLCYHDVDLKAWRIGKDWNKDQPDRVYEITNYSKASYMSFERALHYVENLEKYPNSEKFIVVSFWSNIKEVAFLFREANIKIKVMLKQE